MKEIKTYSISVEEFRKPNNLIYEPNYYLGQKIDRGNYSAFIKDGFAKSLGIETGHYIYCYWTMLHTGFDYITTINNYIRAGGWQILGPVEQSNLYSGYEKVAKYQPKHDINTPEAFGIEFDKQVSKLRWFYKTQGSLGNFKITTSEISQLDAIEVCRRITQYGLRYKSGEERY